MSLVVSLSAAAQSRWSSTLYVGANYSNLKMLQFDLQPIYNKYGGPSFGLGYQLGWNKGYRISEPFDVRAGVRYIYRNSPQATGVVYGVEYDTKMYCIGFTSELAFKLAKSRFALTGGINYDFFFNSSDNVYSLLNQTLPLFGGSNIVSAAYFGCWMWSLGGVYMINSRMSLVLKFEMGFTDLIVFDTDTDPKFGLKNDGFRWRPQGLLLNFNYRLK